MLTVPYQKHEVEEPDDSQQNQHNTCPLGVEQREPIPCPPNWYSTLGWQDLALTLATTWQSYHASLTPPYCHTRRQQWHHLYDYEDYGTAIALTDLTTHTLNHPYNHEKNIMKHTNIFLTEIESPIARTVLEDICDKPIRIQSYCAVARLHGVWEKGTEDLLREIQWINWGRCRVAPTVQHCPPVIGQTTSTSLA
jgi:hypothetical protein